VDRAIIQRCLIVATIASVFAGIVALRLPFCPMASVLGVPCPGCGLTRATLALAHGDLKHALELHPLVLVLAPLFIGALASAAIGYVRGPHPHPHPRTLPRPREAQPARLWLASRDAQPARLWLASRDAQPARLWLASRSMTALATVLMLATLGVWGARFFGYFGGPAPVETLSDWSRTRLAAHRNSLTP
jgi:hypothetical protein